VTPETEAPSLSLRGHIEGTLAEESVGYNPPSTPVLPITGEGETIPDDAINGIDQNILTLDQTREVFVRFVDESSRSIDSLFVHEIGADGSITNIRPVFPYTNETGDLYSNKYPSMPLGTEVSLGTYEEGTQINFFIVNDGGRQINPDFFKEGHFELINPDTGEAARNTDGTPPVLVHVSDDGTRVELQQSALFGTDDSQHTANNNALNPDGEGHVVSGWDDATGSLVFGFEDDSRATKDNDFNDDVYAVRFGSVTEKNVVWIGPDATAGLGADITDADSAQMSGGTVYLTSNFDGDKLVLAESALYGTKIKVDVLSDQQLKFHGVDTIANYEKVMSAVGIEFTGDQAEAGERTIAARVTDTDGNTSNTARTTIDVTDHLMAGTGDDDSLHGISNDGEILLSDGDDAISGRSGDDFINGRSGNDFIDGGEDNDTLWGSIGNDILNGGPGQDKLKGG